MTAPRRAALAAAVLLALAALTALGPTPARAQTGQPFVVTVHLDFESESASAARDEAMAEGQRVAYRTLLERLTLPADHERLPEVSDERLAQLVDSLELADERTSDVRYIANMTVHFRPDPVRQLLDGAGINYVDVASKPVVALPVWRERGRAVLWDDPNPWRDAWERSVPQGGLVPIEVPLGGLEDFQDIDAQQAMNQDAEALAAIGTRHGAGQVLVAVADPQAGQVRVTRFDVLNRQVVPGGTHPLPAAPEEFYTTVHAIVGDLEQRWKQSNVVVFGPEQTINVRVPLETFETWVAVRSRLDQINLVKSTEVLSLRRSEALLTLSYLGDVQRLQTALEQRDLLLTPDDFGGGVGLPAGQSWLLRLARSAGPGPAETPASSPGDGSGFTSPPPWESSPPGAPAPEGTPPSGGAPAPGE